MYNLNYNVTNCRLNKPTGKPFVPTPRLDPYSASLVLAVPGNVFTAGYVPVFSQQTGFEDISNYIKSSSFSYDTNKYTSPLPAHTMTVTGSASSPGFVTQSFAENLFSGSGYLSSIQATGYKCLQVSLDTASYQGINLSVKKDYVIESWIAFDSTASLTYFTCSARPPDVNVDYWGLPNKALAIKTPITPAQLLTPNGTASYWHMPGWGGQRQYGVTGNVSGSSYMGFFPFEQTSDINRTVAVGTVSNKWQIKQWNHWAVSNTYNSGSNTAVVRQYLNGVIIGSTTISSAGIDFVPDVSSSVNSPLFIFGSPQTIYPYDELDSCLDIYNTGSGWYVQDFRMYNGSNKNYTGSQFTPPPSMIIGLKEPYPIVQP